LIIYLNVILLRMDLLLKKIINEIAEEEGLKIDHVELSIRNVCDWTREVFINKEFASVLWPKFGSFTLIEKRIKDEEERKIVEEFKNNFKKNRYDEEKTNQE
jgi:hypothetical protein